MSELEAPHARGGKSKTVQSVDRAVALLRTLARADTPLSVKELANECDLESATAWRLLWTLQTHDLVEKVDDTRAYRLGTAIQELAGGHALDALDAMARVARPLLQRLADRYEVTASFAALERFRVVYIDQADSTHFASPDWRGREATPHASSPGKAILAAMPPREREGILGPTLRRLTDLTITDRDELDAELEKTRAQGYAVCSGEDVTYSNGASAAVSLHGRAVAAINLWGPERLVPPRRLAALGEACIGAARELEELLRTVD